MTGSTTADSLRPADAGNVAIVAFTRRGCDLAMRLATSLEGSVLHPGAAGHWGRAMRCSVSAPERLAAECGIEPFSSLAQWTAQRFDAAHALVFVGAAGIAVRAIAPHVKDKLSDPAVVSVDEAGAFAIPLLSGHVGGANALARAVARACGAQVAVSTATDVNAVFAVDEWAVQRGLCIVERELAKEVSARLLEGGEVGLWARSAYEWSPVEGVIDCAGAPEDAPEARPELGFAVSLDDTCRPFERTLHLVPQTVTVGVGCRKGIAAEALSAQVDAALKDNRVSPHAVARLASIDVKRGEQAIESLARSRGWQLVFYSAGELAGIPGDFSASTFVAETVGVDNVCERAAVAAGGRLLCSKRSGQGVTVALGVNDGAGAR